jgi:plasmid stabilization system protein ParE
MRRLVVSLRAQKQLARAAGWWAKNRDKAPKAFEEDVSKAYEALVATPQMGQPVSSRRGGMRRILLPRIRYYLYYRMNDRGHVEVMAFWHASRRPPHL